MTDLVPLVAMALSASPDLALVGGRIWTGDPDNPWAEVLVVDDGRILYVGAAQGAGDLLEKASVRHDLAGAFVTPGFVDAHIHPLEGGVELSECSLSGLDQEAMIAEVARCTEATDGRGWVVGNGWELTAFMDGNPSATLLDSVRGEHPVFLLAADGHSAWVDHLALERLGLTAETPDPDGGRIERDAAGNPTGTLRETAVDIALEVIPSPTRRERIEGVRRALSLAAKNGITAVFEANADRSYLAAYRALDRRDALTLRVSAALQTDPAAGPEQAAHLAKIARRFDGRGSGMLRVHTAKIFVDGVIEARTAAMLAPYLDTGDTGAPQWTVEQLDAMVAELTAHDLDVHFHAIGDRAVRMSLDAIEARSNPARHSAIAHLEVVDTNDVPRFAALGVSAVFQPLWAQPDEYVRDLTWPGLSTEIGARLYPIGALARAQASVAFGSDWSVSTLDPLDGIEVAVRRADPDSGAADVPPPEALGLDQALTVEAAFEAYTRHAARVLGLEDEIGTLSAGKRADFCVLSADPFSVPSEEISEITVTWTVRDGISVFGGDTLAR